MPAVDVSIKAEFKAEGAYTGMTWAEFNVNTPGTLTAAATDYRMSYQWNRSKA